MAISRVVLEPPNSGYGWIVVLGALLINMVTKAFNSVFSLLYGPFFSSINIAQSEISLVMNLSTFFGSLASIFTGAILKSFTVRQVAVTGCFLISIGMILSSFTVSAYQTILTYSLIGGFGFGLLVNTSLVAVASYFTTNKKRAVSLSLTGTGIGQILLPQIVHYLNSHYTTNESIMIMGGLMLNGVIGALLFQPVEKHLKRRTIDETQSLTSMSIDIPHPVNEDNLSFWRKFINTMDLGLLEDSRFIILNFVLACSYAVASDFNLILTFFLHTKMTETQTTTCLSVLATFDLISRLTFHFITDYTSLSSRQILVIGVFCLGILKTTITFLTTYESILFTLSIYGYFRAIVFVNQILVLSEHCTKYYPRRFAGALGLNMAFTGISTLFFGQLFGIFRNYISDFSYSFYLEDTFVISIMSIWFIEYLYHLKN
ncbi:monocarboxylate transporter 12-like [Chironomus tepperi]|uniref:monocarboxylate transporter 12-like n=1 Tax=Chironomus tepperi TaxID=113505 RepID=UPI00391F61E5